MSMFDNYPDAQGYVPNNHPEPLFETIKQGETKTIDFDIDVETTNITSLDVSFIQGFDIIVQKDLEDVTLGTNKVTITLSETDTLKFNQFEFTYAQVRLKKTVSGVTTTYNGPIEKIFVEGAVNPTSL